RRIECGATGRATAPRAASADRFFFSSRGRHTRSYGDWSSDVCSSDLVPGGEGQEARHPADRGQEIGAGSARGGRRPGDPRGATRSEERRVGKECRSRWSRYPKTELYRWPLKLDDAGGAGTGSGSSGAL